MKLLNLAAYPFYGMQVFSKSKSFERNPIIGSEWLNRKGLHIKRVEYAQRLSDFRRKTLGQPLSSELKLSYETNGFVQINNFLPKSTFESLRREVEETDFLRYDMLQGSTITRRAVTDRAELSFLPAMREFCFSSKFIQLMRYVAGVGGQPLISLQSVHANPVTNVDENDPQTVLHSDTFHSTSKAWLFLHDVHEDEGPFSYVPGSHRMTEPRRDWEQEISFNYKSINNEHVRNGSLRASPELLSELGYGQPKKMSVPANTLVVADTHGFHARSPSFQRTTRIEMYGSLRRNPFCPWSGGDLFSIPFIGGNYNRIMFNGLKLLENVHIASSPWVCAGKGKVDEWPVQLQEEHEV
ncbi:phytanoyl-CoA dioxygenase family protein [Sneathiella limimaris]|uniref:phytanoyl-CoA dioxygenase family protein n=1 Tax=Sneathiella limimaris TaxID=1964213 RepID=UPI00146C9C01|nr:phytanoyl-CoA dioxygenase family protein [Sneathiella limimaris]